MPPPRPGDLRAPEKQAPDVKGSPIDLDIPTPPPRPGDLSSPAVPQSPEAAAPAPAPVPPEELEKDAATCRQLLDSGTVVAHVIAPIRGPGECGIAAPVSLEAIVIGDKRVALDPAPSIRCDLAATLARWIIEDVDPALSAQGLRLERVTNANAYSCRSRNHVFGAKLSEHGKGNAIDLDSLIVSPARRINLTAPESAPLATLLKTSACARFATVLGPGSDGYHNSHIHVDLEDRRSHGALCQWNLTPAGPEAPAAKP